MGVSERTLDRWKRKHAGMGVGELRRGKQAGGGEENRKLNALVADLSPDEHIVHGVVQMEL